jgi:RimJ/RimL family protein N-acetyltransferase
MPVPRFTAGAGMSACLFFHNIPIIEEPPMHELPTIDTPRLRLRPFTPQDAPRLAHLCADPDVASTTLNLPHPYQLSDAQRWIPKHAEEFDSGVAMTLAVTMRDVELLVGNITLRLCRSHNSGELGYLVGRRYWGRGYCTEAARAVVAYAFAELGLERVEAQHFARNPASGRVMEKIGMTREGLLRQSLCRWGQREDAIIYGILKQDAEQRCSFSPA